MVLVTGQNHTQSGPEVPNNSLTTICPVVLILQCSGINSCPYILQCLINSKRNFAPAALRSVFLKEMLPYSLKKRVKSNAAQNFLSFSVNGALLVCRACCGEDKTSNGYWANHLLRMMGERP